MKRRLGVRRPKEPEISPQDLVLEAPLTSYAILVLLLSTAFVLFRLVTVAPKSSHWETSSLDRLLSRTVSPSVRVIECPDRKLVLHPALSAAELRLLEEQLDSKDLVRYHFGTYQVSWPEYLGFLLQGFFALACLWFLFSWASGEWTEKRARWVVPRKLTAFACLYATYGIGAWLGWFWLSPYPFFVMFLALCVFGRWAHLLPRDLLLPENRSAKRCKPSYLTVTSAPPGLGPKKQMTKRSNLKVGLLEDSQKERFFSDWMARVAEENPFVMQILLQRHGLRTLLEILDEFYDNGQLCIPEGEIFETLIHHSGSREQLLAQLRAVATRASVRSRS
jgi:hypothetical protein